MSRAFVLSSIVIVLLLNLPAAVAQASSFTYQGQLRLTGEPFTGMADLEFRLYDQLIDGNPIGSTQSLNGVPVENGLFQVELDFGANAFDGSVRFLEITVDGAPLNPRQKLTATPYALLATGLASGSVGGGSVDPTEVQLRVTGTCPSGEAIQVVNQDGSVQCEASGGLAGNAWSLSGNAGTDSTIDFIGTTDAAALEIRTANARSLRIEPSNELFGGLPNTSNFIAGSRSNEVFSGVRGATISGGGLPAGDSDPIFPFPSPNLVFGSFGTIGGGYANQAGINDGNPLTAALSTVGGGSENTTSQQWATVAGGNKNTAAGSRSSIGGGANNLASGGSSTVSGGSGNAASGFHSTISGGLDNQTSGNESTIAGGRDNVASATQATIGGGSGNSASNVGATVGGGSDNNASSNGTTIAGGANNVASATASTVSGGWNNTASGFWSSIAGGRLNVAAGDYSFVTGLRAKNADSSHDGVFMFADSQDADFVSTGSDQFLVRAQGGMALNTNSPRGVLTVEGNDNWRPSSGNGFGDFHVGTSSLGLAVGVAQGGGGAGVVRLWTTGGVDLIRFVSSSGTDTLTLTGNPSGTGQVGVGRTAATNALEVNGNASKSTSGSWLANSDRRIKTEVQEIDNALDRLMQVRPVMFRYTEDYLQTHPTISDAVYYNVIAQEFAEVFPDAVQGSGDVVPGEDKAAGNEILQVDVHPALMTSISAIQELAVRLAQAEARSAGLAAQNRKLEARLDRIESILATSGDSSR